MATIKEIVAREVLDSRGWPTIEVDLYTDSGACGRGVVPSGASTGEHEALELRDGDIGRYWGKGMLRAVDNVRNCIRPLLLGKSVFEQEVLDKAMIELDGSKSKDNLGANAILSTSMAICRAAACEMKMPLWSYLALELKVPHSKGHLNSSDESMPIPMMNVINGGVHAANSLDIQEFMLVPNVNKSFAENVRAGVEVFHKLRELLKKDGHATNVGDEGGLAPNLTSGEEALDYMVKAIELANYNTSDFRLALDVAASELYNNGLYHMQGKGLSSEEMISYYETLVNKYPICSIEDGLAEDDLTGWKKMTHKLGDKLLLVGDDLFVTNREFLARGIKAKEANSILIKVNQIGSLTETFHTLDLAFRNDFQVIVSHRSGETGDTFIADLAFAIGASYIKAGSASRSERVEKYNQLMRIESERQKYL